jgi:enoyl-CoA hydratase/carnithine racemase
MDATKPNDVVLAETVGRVRVVTLNRPDKLNAISRALISGLLAAMRAAADDETVHVVVLTGAGRAFCAGADLEEMAIAAAPEETERTESRAPENDFDRLQALLEAYPKPIVGAVRGLGVGFGFTVLGYFDFCYVGESARLRTPFSQLGLSPEASSSYLFPLRMGWATAARALMLGDWFNAQEVVDAGLAQAVIPDESLMTEALALAGRLAACPLQSLIATKSLMLQAHLRHLTDVRALERENLNRLVGTAANREALAAFAARADRSRTKA